MRTPCTPPALPPWPALLLALLACNTPSATAAATANPPPEEPPRFGRYLGVANDLYEPNWAMFTDDHRAIVRLGDGSFIAITIQPDPDAWSTTTHPLDADEASEAHHASRSTHEPPADRAGDPFASLDPAPFHRITHIHDDRQRTILLDTYASTLHRATPPNSERPTEWQSVGGWGAFPGLMAHPHGLTSHAGRLYIADTRNHRIQVFNDRLEYESEWGLHVVRPHEGQGHLHYPTSIAIAPAGDIAMVCEPAQDRIQFFAPLLTDDEQAEVTQPLFQRETIAHFGPHAASDGPLLITTEPDRPGLIVWDLTRPLPIMIGRIAGHGDDFGHFRAIGDVSLAIEGPNGSPRVWVFDPAHRRIQTFDLDWSPDKPLGFDPFLARFVRAIDLDALPIADQPGRISRALRCADGSWVLLTTPSPSVWLTEPDLHQATKLCSLHAHDRIALLEDGTTLAILGARSGQLRLIPIDGSDRPIRAFVLIDNSGPTRSHWNWLTEPLEEPGDPGTARLLFQPAHPFEYDAILLEDDRLWITDRRSHRVLGYDLGEAATRYSPPSIVPHADALVEKSMIAPLITLGLVDGNIPTDPRNRLGPALFHKPSGLAIDNLGNIIVIDEGNHRIQFLYRDGKFLDALGARLFTTPATRDAPGRFDP